MTYEDDLTRQRVVKSATAGIDRIRPFDAVAFKQAVTDMLGASGFDTETVHMTRTAERVCELWQRRLLDGYDVNPADSLGQGFADIGVSAGLGIMGPNLGMTGGFNFGMGSSNSNDARGGPADLSDFICR